MIRSDPSTYNGTDGLEDFGWTDPVTKKWRTQKTPWTYTADTTTDQDGKPKTTYVFTFHDNTQNYITQILRLNIP